MDRLISCPKLVIDFDSNSLENLLSRIGADKDTISLTNCELVRYLKAMDKAEFTTSYILNPSDTQLWFEVCGNVVSVNPYGVYKIK